jgi:hypothetical protein
MPQYLPNIRGLVSDRVEAEIHRAFKALYEYIDNQVAKIETTTTTINTNEIKRQVQLFAGGLALPLTDPSGDNLVTAGVDAILTPSDIPNLPASKITSGTFPLTRLPINILKTDDAFTIVPGLFVVGGKIIIKDNFGNFVEILTP